MKRVLVISPCISGDLPTQGVIIAERLRNSGVPVSILSRAQNRWMRAIDIALTGFGWAYKHDVLLVNTFGNKAFLYEALAILYGRIHKKRVVVIIRGGSMVQFVAKWPIATRYVLSKADVILTPHNFLKEQLSLLGVKIHGTIPNFIDLEKYQFRLRSNLRPRLLYLRGTHPIYNPEMALQTFALIQNKHPEARLTMAGKDSTNTEHCQRLAKRLKLKNVHFIGLVPKESIPELANRHDLYIQTNRIDNFPVTVIEMWASGLPVVATEVGGIPFLVNQGEDGLLVKSEDHHAMATACLELLNDPHLARKLSQKGRKLAEKFCWDKIEPLWRQVLLLEN